nr:MAG TPA: hypothetical protein [Caudoviricetes sp.]
MIIGVRLWLHPRQATGFTTNSLNICLKAKAGHHRPRFIWPCLPLSRN